jgi:hypothetical protein
MAQDASEQPVEPFVVAQKSDIKAMLDTYEELNDEKKIPAEKQKTLLDEFNRKHSVPPWISKILRKFENLKDEGERAASWRALKHAGSQLGFDDQFDIEDVARKDAA